MSDIVNDYQNAKRVIAQKVLVENPSVMATVLKDIVAKEGVDIYRDVEKLSERMKERNCQLTYIKQVELAVSSGSLVRYLEQLTTGLSAIDINNIIITTEGAGLSSSAARKVVADILYSLNVPQLAQEVADIQRKDISEMSKIYIPPQAYSSRLREFVALTDGGGTLSQEQMSELLGFVKAGIPEASTLLGKLYLVGNGVPKDHEKALEILGHAASTGDAAAYGCLGDYYYNKDNEAAHQLYSSPGALALNEERWNKFRNLEKCKKFHRIQAVLLVLLLIFLEVFMFVFRYSALTGAQPVTLILCTLLNLATAGATVFVHIKNPFQDLRNYSLPMLVSFFIFGLSLIL